MWEFDQSCHLKFFGVISMILYIKYCLIFIFLSFIAKKIAICRLEGMITTQKVLFYTLKLTLFKHFWVIINTF